jgi:hypothetical protein
MSLTQQPGPAPAESGAGQRTRLESGRAGLCTRPPVDELLQNRHTIAVAAAVESPSRAAGGFPTLGGGARGHSRPDLAGLGVGVSAPLAAGGAGRRGGAA